MVTNFNFATEQSNVPPGYTLDFGEAYSEEKGYGWVQESDLTTPLELTPNGRDRGFEKRPLLGTLIHMEYPADNPNQTAIRTPGAWQYDVLDGEYRVTVSVGDDIYEDSNHTISVEGLNLIENFVPSQTITHATGTRILAVTDGQLTVDAIGGENTKINFIDIAPLSAVLVNFGASTSPAPENAIRDFGQAYSQQQGYGWITEDSVGDSQPTPLDITLNGRDRNLVEDNLTDSFIHMQYPENTVTDPVRTPAAWEYDLPNGEYQVTVAVGDAAYEDSSHTINIEGVSFIDDFVPSEDDLFTESYGIVEVSDGKLSVDAVGGDNTKLNYLSIAPVIDVKVNFGSFGITTDEFPGPELPGVAGGFESDIGEAYSEERGYGWISQDSVGEENPTPLDITGNNRIRFLVDDFFADSLIHMQYPEEIENDEANKTPAAWEYALPNGFYDVTVGVGDAAYSDSIHSINIEGIDAIESFIPSSTELFTTGTITGVEVTDGKLTIDAIGGDNTKINFVEIISTEN